MQTLLLLGKQRHENGVIKTGSSFSPDTNSSLSLPLLKRMMETTGLFFCYVPLSGLGCSVNTQIPQCHEHWALGWTMTHAPWEAMVSLFGFSPNGHPWLSGWLAAGMSLETCGLPFYVHRRAIACQQRDLGAVEQRSSEKSFQINEVDLDGPVAEVTALVKSAGHVWGLSWKAGCLGNTCYIPGLCIQGFWTLILWEKKNERKKSIYFCDFFFLVSMCMSACCACLCLKFLGHASSVFSWPSILEDTIQPITPCPHYLFSESRENSAGLAWDCWAQGWVW